MIPVWSDVAVLVAYGKRKAQGKGPESFHRGGKFSKGRKLKAEKSLSPFCKEEEED